MKWKLIEEANKTPSDKESIDMSFNKDVSDEKYVPTVEFVKIVYDKFNKELFSNRLPSSNVLNIGVVSMNKDNGITIAHDEDGSIVIDGLNFSNSTSLTMHTWMETILHEMVHVDELCNHPEHFKNGVENKGHGKWFKEQARKFKEMGFDVSEKYEGDFGTNTEDKAYLNNKDGMFIKTGDNPMGFAELVKIPNDEYGYALNRLRDSGYAKVWLMKTSNDNAGRLEFSKCDDEYGYFKYHLDDRFNKAFGPFEKTKEIDLKHIVAESKDDYFMPGDVIEVNTRGFKQFVRNGVRHYIFVD